ncbi:lamin tail domain-containing protein [Desulfosarcina ovata]|uniref:Endoribonuclease n=1 Tax=Desulfosarcina ovata subsp. ovata TaxID=2752305 RepID=A0A5K8AAQ6_9BACT|nr:lamin tail domain-containing protein [Desulfosarcina ovata]BBO89722.1 endoribonuclease [Desulfosarcina ovata subsp. ovata]
MADIYQQIWDADQSGSGVRPILDTESGDPSTGFVKVNSRLTATDRDLRVLTETVIPESKRRSYELCRVLFDNYALPERDEEQETAQEREEVHDLVHAMVDTPPMLVARDYVARATETSITRERWYNTLMEMWFRRFSMGGDPHLTGFEHVAVGEQEGAKAQGYHFWYKYYLDDGFARQVDGATNHFPGLSDDRIVYLGSKQSAEQSQFPESVTISYRWQAPDYDRDALRPLTKKIGGFFVGCSVEGLLALGTVRAHVGARAPKDAVINGARYHLKVFRDDSNRHVRTFYPVFSGAEGPTIPSTPPVTPTDIDIPVPPATPVVDGRIRIIAALVNPEGHDPGSESVTLINTGSAAAALDGWHLEDRNARRQPLSGMTVGAGETLRVVLDPSGVQLSNKGGSIRLLDANDHAVHLVTYSKGQVKTQGETILL